MQKCATALLNFGVMCCAQGLRWIRDLQLLCLIKSFWSLYSTGFKSAFLSFSGFVLVAFYVAFDSQYAKLVYQYNFRKDTYGVFSEPVDPKEVSCGSDDTLNSKAFGKKAVFLICCIFWFCCSAP